MLLLQRGRLMMSRLRRSPHNLLREGVITAATRRSRVDFSRRIRLIVEHRSTRGGSTSTTAAACEILRTILDHKQTRIDRHCIRDETSIRDRLPHWRLLLRLRVEHLRVESIQNTAISPLNFVNELFEASLRLQLQLRLPIETKLLPLFLRVFYQGVSQLPTHPFIPRLNLQSEVTCPLSPQISHLISTFVKEGLRWSSPHESLSPKSPLLTYWCTPRTCVLSDGT